jgi:tRNA nucleotidyltransferase (CCA-adding enzyme)
VNKNPNIVILRTKVVVFFIPLRKLMNFDKTDIIAYLLSKKEYFYSTYRIVQIGLFGSFARGTEKDESDIDILIEFESNINKVCLD